MNRRPDTIPPGDSKAGTDWGALDSRVSTAVQDIQAALEEALAATRDLAAWVERLRTLSAFMGEIETGLVEVRHRLEGSSWDRRPVAVPSPVPKAEAPKAEQPWASEPAPAEVKVDEEPPAAPETPQAEGGAEPSEAAAVAEAEQPPEPAQGEPPAEGEPLEEAPSASEAGGSVHLEIESSEVNIDLMVVERALRETPGVADVDLLDYAGKRATVRVTLSEGERPEETGDPERLAAHVQEQLAKLTWDGSLSVSVAE